jgi:TonB-linked SusC/RagA family outer membrane protein
MKIFIRKKHLYPIVAKLFLLFLIPAGAFAQTESQPIINSKLNGTVIDAVTKQPVPGAVVRIKGTTHAVATDDKGKFSFVTGQKFPYILIVTFVGFKTQELTVDGSPVQIQLAEDITSLNDVVVVGYGTQTRKDLVSAISTIKSDNEKQIPVASFDAQLQGKAAGLQINSNTGTPGDGIFVRVRGTTSINATNDPLYVVDGVFINNTSLQTISTGNRATSPIADINPADIENIEVLKDASATAIYGSRGANGVVIVTTKRGKYNAKPTINFSTSQGVAYQPKGDLWQLTTGPEHAQIVNEFYANSEADAIKAGNTAGINTYKYLPFRALTDNPTQSPAPRGLPQDQHTYDRLSELFRTGRLSNYDLSLAGGSRDTKYFIAAGYTHQDADIKPIYFERSDFRVNLDQRVNDHLQVGVSNTLSRSFRNQARAGDGPAGGLFQAALHTPTYLPEFNADGTPARWAGFDNLQVLLDNYNVNTISLRYIGNVYAEYQIIKGLKFKTSWSLDYNNYNESEYWNDKTQLGAAPTNGLATSSITDASAWINEQTLNYHTNFGKHILDVVVGNTLQSNTTKNTSAQGSGFPNNAYTDISSAATRTAGQTWSKGTLSSYFSRVAYNYNGKYYLEASARADGSSKFGANNKWGYFPAVGAAWRLKEENFLRDVSTISDFKLRASYGSTGNQAGINNFAAQGLWNGGAGYPDNTTGGDKAGTAPQQLPNKDLKWERTTQADAGLNFGLFGKINLEFDVYSKTTTNVLLQTPVPAISGFTSVYSNIGKVTNKGYEIAISSQNFKTKDFSWQTDFNISGNVNKVVTLPSPISEYNRDWIRLQQGYSMYSFWLYKQVSVDPQTGNAIFQHADGTTGTNVTVADRQVLGNALPKFFGGFTNNFTFKDFDAGVTFSYQYGNKVLNLNRFFGEGGGTRDANRVIFASQLNRWTTPGQITDVPRVTAYGNNYTLDQNSRFLEDGSFIRLKTLTLGYTIPKEITQKINIHSLRVYVVGSNLLLFTKYTGVDPESNVTSNAQTQGLDLGSPPQPHTIQFGVNLTL